MAFLSIEIPASSDDGYWAATGTPEESITTARNYFGTYAPLSQNYSTCLRFPNVTIPPGSTIDTAFLMIIGASSGGGVTASIKAIDEDNTATFSLGDLPLARSLTASGGNISILGSGADVLTVSDNIKSAIQAVIGRGGWASGNALGLQLDSNPTGQSYYAGFLSADGGSGKPVLVIGYTPPGGSLFNSGVVASGDDDAIEGDPTWGYTGALVYAGHQTSPGDLNAYFRWRNVTIPKDAVILSAYILLNTNGGPGTNPIKLLIQGIDEDDTADFTSNASGRARTTASTFWAPPHSTASVMTTDITGIIQEITSRAGWASGNSLGIVIKNNGTAGNNYLPIKAYETSGNVSGATLVVYTEGVNAYTLAMDPGTFDMVGTAILLSRSALSFGLSPGVYSMVGSPLSVWKTHPPMVLDPGSFAMTGVALSIKRPVSYMRMDPGAFAMSGKPVDVKYHWFSGDASADYQFPKQRRNF